MSLDDLYKETILDHYQEPRNRGQLVDPDVATRGHNPLCGDEVQLQVQLADDAIRDIAFGGRGCSISQASASMMTESVKGEPLAEVDRLMAAFKEMMVGSGSTDGLDGHEDLEALQGVKRFPVRVKCALLPWTALAEALEIWRRAARASLDHKES
ncbi:MAG TPA: SUF system NifU family Fe-S cluster assembly protein [Chloroflexota bacterium]|nr:SUF system NifU family Fe-S cluster assembly protein [Chloroflexota bacterium]